MNPSDAMMQLKALGYTIDCGYVFNGKFRYGRILEDAFIPEGDSAITIPWSEIVEFHSIEQGSFGSYLIVVKTDGGDTELKRSELPERNGYSGLKPNPNGEGFLMPYSISDLMDAWKYVFPDFRENAGRRSP